MQKETQSRRLWRLSAMGFTFASMVIAGGLLGLGIVWGLSQFDPAWMEQKRNFILWGSICGIMVGMYDFIRDSMRAIKDQNNDST